MELSKETKAGMEHSAMTGWPIDFTEPGTLKLLAILAIGRRQVKEGKVRPAEDVIAEMRTNKT